MASETELTSHEYVHPKNLTRSRLSDGRDCHTPRRIGENAKATFASMIGRRVQEQMPGKAVA